MCAVNFQQEDASAVQVHYLTAHVFFVLLQIGVIGKCLVVAWQI